MATTMDYISQLKEDKKNLVSMLNSMGVEATDSDTFTSLTPKVGKIVTDPILQDKSVEITENGTTNIVADEGYDGLNNVDVTVNVASSGGDDSTKGIVFSDWDNAGYPLTATFIGFTSVPMGYFERNPSTRTMVYHKVETINLNENMTKINQNAFNQLESLKNINLPSTLELIATNAFNSCINLISVSMPNRIKNVGSQSFNYCPNLKAVWIGSGVTSSTFFSAFNNCSNLAKMFINLPRATVETFSYYSSAFSGGTLTTDVIICNDDEGFMTKEEFDAIDWATYTG